MVVLWTSVSIHNARFNTTVSLMRKYINCMSGGIQKEQDCEPYRKELETVSLPGLRILYNTLSASLSYSNLPFLIQFKTVKEFVVKTVKKLNVRKSNSSS